MKLATIMGLGVVSTALCFVGGCAPSEAKITRTVTPYRDQNINLVKPNFIVVHKPAVTPQDIRAITPSWYPKGGSDHTVSEEERSIGESLSNAVQREIVSRLNAAHIEAYPAGTKDETSFKTGVLQGYFFETSKANTSAHELGFNLDNNTYRVRFLANVKEVPIAELTIDVSESRLHDVDDKDMQVRIDREAAAIAKQVVDDALIPAYKHRGWLK